MRLYKPSIQPNNRKKKNVNFQAPKCQNVKILFLKIWKVPLFLFEETISSYSHWVKFFNRPIFIGNWNFFKQLFASFSGNTQPEVNIKQNPIFDSKEADYSVTDFVKTEAQKPPPPSNAVHVRVSQLFIFYLFLLAPNFKESNWDEPKKVYRFYFVESLFYFQFLLVLEFIRLFIRELSRLFECSFFTWRLDLVKDTLLRSG